MNTVKRIGIAAALVATAILSANPASATGVHPPVVPPKVGGGGGGGGSVPGALICVWGSALGLIGASIAKGTALGNPLRWRSQAEHEKIVASGYEKQFELTNSEATVIAFTCGAGYFYVVGKYRQNRTPAKNVVVVKY